MGDIWGLQIYIYKCQNTLSPHTKSFNIPISIGHTTLTHMTNQGLTSRLVLWPPIFQCGPLTFKQHCPKGTSRFSKFIHTYYIGCTIGNVRASCLLHPLVQKGIEQKYLRSSPTNGHVKCLNTINYQIFNMHDIRYWLCNSMWECFGQLVFRLCIELHKITCTVYIADQNLQSSSNLFSIN